MVRLVLAALTGKSFAAVGLDQPSIPKLPTHHAV
jgi:hypothetical protein